MNTPSEGTKKYISELNAFINEALDDYVEARNSLNHAKERIIDSIKELGFSESQSRTLAEGWCDVAYKASTTGVPIRNDI